MAIESRGRLRQFLGYAKQVYGLGHLLDCIRDRREEAEVSTALIARTVFLTGLLRLRSFNALEPKLAELHMQRALDARPRRNGKICSVDTLSYSLARMRVETVRGAVVALNQKAERNKVFREGGFHALRFVALDGWEPFKSRSRCCSACLTRQVKQGKKTVTEHYHSFVVALLLDERLEVVLDMESIRSADVRKEVGEVDVQGHEGELTAAKRLVQRLRTTYGRWLDVLVVDGLYPNGPFLSIAKQCGYGVIAVIKKPTDEPLKEALALWKKQPPAIVLKDKSKREHIELWDCPQLETLQTYQGPIRVVRAVITKQDTDAQPSTWCFAVTGKATRLNAEQVLRTGRSRWHLENTGFCQWTRYWKFCHVFTHSPEAVLSLFWLFFLAFNLLQLFAYRQLRSYGRDRGKDVTRTLWRLIDEMNADLERLDHVHVWDSS